MWHPFCAVVLSLCISFGCLLNGQEKPAPSASESQTFLFTKRQLDALKYLIEHRTKVEYTWDWATGASAAWEPGFATRPVFPTRYDPSRGRSLVWEPAQPAPFDESEWTGKVPIYYVKGHPWLTNDAVLETLLAFPDIRTVNIAYCCNVTDKGISHLAKLQSLRHLVMYRNSARYGGMLLEYPPFEGRDKMPQRLTDKAIEHLCGMKQLESLFIWDNEFSERAILTLGQIKSLKRLGIRENQISNDGLVRLREMLPACEFDGIGVSTLRATDPAPKEKQRQFPH